MIQVRPRFWSTKVMLPRAVSELWCFGVYSRVYAPVAVALEPSSATTSWRSVIFMLIDCAASKLA